MDLTEEQKDVFEAAIDFLVDPNVKRPYFLYEGPAGTGKSVVLAEIARETRGQSLLCAFTGKAASVLGRKSKMYATTIHSAIYHFEGHDRETKELAFSPKVEDGEWIGRAALIDESGTVWEDLARDLLATGCKVIACGDPGQLPPVKGLRFFQQPDMKLTQVHRQALDSPIIRQAHAVLNGKMYQPDGDDFRVQRNIGSEDIIACDIILCWKNETRHYLNLLKRQHLKIDGPVRKGEPLMCLKNNHAAGIMNGAIYPSLNDRRPYDPIFINNERGEAVEIYGFVESLEGPIGESEYGDKPTPFCLGYAATVHKFQGSESDFIILCDEYTSRDQRTAWLYTALTRAAKRIIVHREW